ncbi:MAG: hemolysin family protein [Candidatus Micrarchaeota archaeon]|nr:hemolysin family protein [Candidatus Micrarchaeota archaeon]
MSLFGDALTLVFLLVLSGFFSAAEVAFLSVTRVQLSRLRDEKRAGAESLHRLKQNTPRTIITILIGNNVVNVGASVLAAQVALFLFGNAGLSIATAVMTLLLLTFGEITPKTLASAHHLSVARRFAPVLEVLQVALFPAIWFFEQIIRLVPGSYQKGVVRVTEEEIRAAVRLGVSDKSVSEHEKKLIENVFLFNDKKVSQCMTSKSTSHTLSPDLHVDVALHKALQSPHSRFPVVSGSRIVGVVSLKRLSHAAMHHSHDSVAKHMLPAVVVDQDKSASDAFSYLQNKGVNMAAVVGKTGAYVGVVTLKDLLEELVGEIE